MNHEEMEARIYELGHWSQLNESDRRLKYIQRPKWWSSRLTRHDDLRIRSRLADRHNSLLWRFLHLVALTGFVVFALVPLCAIFFPSYTNPPERYVELRDRVLRDQTANINNENVFIAASLYDHEGELLSGQWGQAVLELVEILGNENVFLSIYENNPDDKAQAALDLFAESVRCEKELKAENLDLAAYPHVTTPDGRQRVKRISFLADVRNRALKPLQDPNSPAFNTRFDKILYLNDVVFDPVDAANLLFSTNMNEETGRTQYRAACAIDFINVFKYYDTYATRDIEGYEMGIPLYPWFAADTQSRRDVLEQKDAVQVKSCWGGMVAFEAKWFQSRSNGDKQEEPMPSGSTQASPDLANHTDVRNGNTSSITSLRFRASTDTYWDGSECCFIHADLSFLESSALSEGDTGIYMNPYIRVAYSGSVLPWLAFTKRFERLYTPFHAILNWITSKPSYNPRRLQRPGEEVVDRVWAWDAESQAKLREGSVDDLSGSFQEVRRTALPGAFCGLRKLSYINEHPEPGEKHYVTIPGPVVA